MLEEDEFSAINRLIIKARIPGRMTQSKLEMVPMMTIYSDKAHKTIESLLKKLLSDKYGEFEF